MSLRVEGLTSGYGETTVLWEVSLETRPGSISCLLGLNGAGKTTLLKTIMGLLPIRKGDILFEGSSLKGLPAHAIARRGIAYAPQDTALFADLTVEQNMRVAFRANGRFDAALDRALKPFPVLMERLNQRAGTLSGGEQKMLFVSRALLTQPKLILLDEVTEGVQPSILKQIQTALKETNAVLNTAIVLVEQNIGFALEISEYFWVMKQGRLVAQGSVDEPESRASIEKSLAI